MFVCRRSRCAALLYGSAWLDGLRLCVCQVGCYIWNANNNLNAYAFYNVEFLSSGRVLPNPPRITVAAFADDPRPDVDIALVFVFYYLAEEVQVPAPVVHLVLNWACAIGTSSQRTTQILWKIWRDELSGLVRYFHNIWNVSTATILGNEAQTSVQPAGLFSVTVVWGRPHHGKMLTTGLLLHAKYWSCPTIHSKVLGCIRVIWEF